MRILLLAPHPFFQHRGTPLAEKALIECLTGEGHLVDVLTYHEGEDIAVPGCRIFRIPRLPGIRNVRPGFSMKKVLCNLVLLGSTARRLRTVRYDLIHAVEESALIAAVLGRIFSLPYVYDMDSSLPEQLIEAYPVLRPLTPLMTAVERHSVRQSRGVLAVCRSVEEVARRHASGQRIARVEDSTLLTGHEAELPSLWPGARHTIMYAGNLERYQGIDLLLQAFAVMLQEVPDAHLIVIGGTPRTIEQYRGVAASLGIAASVLFTGPRPVHELGACLRQADIVVSPRLTGHNTPMKIYSYLDSGRPVVATRIATHTQVLDDEIACLVAPTPEALARGLVDLLRDPERRALLAASARARVQALYTPAAAQQKLREFYRELEASLSGEPVA